MADPLQNRDPSAGFDLLGLNNPRPPGSAARTCLFAQRKTCPNCAPNRGERPHERSASAFATQTTVPTILRKLFLGRAAQGCDGTRERHRVRVNQSGNTRPREKACLSERKRGDWLCLDLKIQSMIRVYPIWVWLNPRPRIWHFQPVFPCLFRTL